MGGICASSKGLIGYSHAVVKYTITATQDTNVLCNIVGLNSDPYYCPGGRVSCKWGMQSGGITSSQGAEFVAYWDANAGTPSIQCQSWGLGTTIEWEWELAQASPCSC